MSGAPPTPNGQNPPELGEGLLASSTIRLFGRPFLGLRLGTLGAAPASNNPLAAAFRAAGAAGNEQSLARIYGFSYLGNYFKLAEPLVFLVYGPGVDVKSGPA